MLAYAKRSTCQFKRWNLLLFEVGVLFKMSVSFCELWIHLRIDWSAHDTVFFLSSSLIWLITVRQEAWQLVLEQALSCPPLKLCNFAQNGTWTSTFINQHCLPPRKMQIRSSRALFICTKEAIYWLLHSEHMDKTPKVTTFTFNFL